MRREAKVYELVDWIQRRHLQLPEMQRQYVWRAPRVRGLLDSPYRSLKPSKDWALHGAWLLIATNGDGGRPILDGEPVPVIDSTGWAEVPRAWIQEGASGAGVVIVGSARHRQGAS